MNYAEFAVLCLAFKVPLNGAGVSPGGNFIPTLTAVGGCSSLVNINSFYSANVNESGGVVTVTCRLSYTATATTQVFKISCPIAPNFTGLGQASGIATIFQNVSPALGDGNALEINSADGVNYVTATMLTAATGAVTATLVFQYKIQ